MKGNLFLPLVFCLLITPILSANAEDDRGRLSDGRAYRTDTAGNQLVDYIAELEVNNDALQRRVYGLEDEINQKNQQLAKLTSQLGASAEVKPLVERDLAGSQKNVSKASAQDTLVQQQCEKVKKELVSLQGIMKEERQQSEQSLADYQRRIGELENERSSSIKAISSQCGKDLEMVRTALSTEKGEREKEKASFQSESESLHSRISSLTAERDRLQKEVIELNSAGESLRASLKSYEEKSAQAAEEQARLERAQINMVKASRNAVAPTAQTAPVSNLSKVSAATGVPQAGTWNAGRYTSPQLVAAKQRAVESLRGDLLSDVNRLQGLVRQRDAEYRSYEKNRPSTAAAKAVQFKPSIVASSRGMDLTEISTTAKNASSVAELNDLRRDTMEIRRLLQEDMTLIERMSR